MKRFTLAAAVLLLTLGGVVAEAPTASAKPKNGCSTKFRIASAQRLNAGAITAALADATNANAVFDAALSGHVHKSTDGVSYWVWRDPEGFGHTEPVEHFFNETLPTFSLNVDAAESRLYNLQNPPTPVTMDLDAC